MFHTRTLSLAVAMLLSTATGAFAQVQLALSSSQTAQDPLVIAMEAAATRIEERTGGEIDVTVYPSSQLGSDNDVLEQIRNGAAIAVLVDAGRLAAFKPELGILSAPYLVDDYRQYAAITASEPYKVWVEDLAHSSGIRLLNYNWFQGTRQMFTTAPVTQPADLEGVRVRTIDAPSWIATVNAMGATAVPMAWSEVYSGLQLGAIDGAEAQLTGAYGIKLHEVTGNLAFTNHVQLVTGLATSESWFQALTPEQQAILIEELARAGDEASVATVQRGSEVLEEMKAAGVVVNEVNPEEFRAQVEHVYTDLGLVEAREALRPVIEASKP